MFDLLIYIVGYEERSSHIISERKCEESIAIVMSHNQKINFDVNFEAAKKRKSRLSNELNILGDLLAAVQYLSSKSKDSRVNVGLDVSSMNRELMAVVITKLYELYINEKIDFKILYAPGLYQSPKGNNSAYLDLKPVTTLEGWSLYPERPLTLIMGLGYEEDHATAATEYFDPSGIWAFIGTSKNEKWENDVLQANHSLGRIMSDENFLLYSINSPGALFSDLRSLGQVLSEKSRVVIVSGGPKIFSAISILVKLEVGDEVAVWQASAHQYTDVRDTVADGEIVEFEYNA